MLAQFTGIVPSARLLTKTPPLSIQLSPGPLAVAPVEVEPLTSEPPAPTAPPPQSTMPLIRDIPPSPVESSESPSAIALMSKASELAKTPPPTPRGPVFIGREHQPLPRNLTGRVLPMAENRFADTWLPLRPQVLDHWQNRDGSQQNKIRLPNGKVICGRQAASELFEPLVIPIWMYQGC